ncbi:MAG: transporter substrate-binding domain-containing protein [Marinobacter sp.]|uniref:substrate-binding periplasmic protein n=1 Tax=Marinobacter sp. TaxID=50741 RepID=UPI00299D6281|nr:transporter substrate-binding domain-containing protein [Marinobacter sp.]MDX1635896.1 transporter substrate-binding domain-containing protein [Marinobacter sp.]
MKLVPLLRPMLLVFACVTLLADAAASEESVSSQQRLHFATAEVWPWGYLGADGEPAGTLVEFANRIAAIVNLPLMNELRPHRRAIAELASGTADFVVLFDSPTAEAAGIRVDKLLTMSIVIAGRADETYPLTLSGLAGREVAYIRGSYYGEAFARDENIIKVPVDALAQGLEMLRLRRVDAVVSSDQALYRTLEAQGLPASEFRQGLVVGEQSASLFMSRNARFPELLEPVRQAMGRMRKTGELDSIFRLPR